MAELLAIHQDLKNLDPITTLSSNGSAIIKLEGNKEYHPELRLSAEDVKNILKVLNPTIVINQPEVLPEQIPFEV